MSRLKTFIKSPLAHCLLFFSLFCVPSYSVHATTKDHSEAWDQKKLVAEFSELRLNSGAKNHQNFFLANAAFWSVYCDLTLFNKNQPESSQYLPTKKEIERVINNIKTDGRNSLTDEKMIHCFVVTNEDEKIVQRTYDLFRRIYPVGVTDENNMHASNSPHQRLSMSLIYYTKLFNGTSLPVKVEFKSASDFQGLPFREERKLNQVEWAIGQLYQSAQKEISKRPLVLQGLRLYTPLHVSSLPLSDSSLQGFPGTNLRLDDVIKDFLQGENPLLLLQGDAGAGKSLYGRYLEKKSWEHYESHRAVPLFISLASDYDGNDTIHAALKRKGLDEEAIKNVQKHFSFIFFFDGFDEIKVQYDEKCKQNELPLSFYDHVGLSKWKAKSIVSNENQTVKNVDKPSAYFNAGNRRLVKMYIRPFSDHDVNYYINLFVKSPFNQAHWKAKQYMKTLESCTGLKNEAYNPFALFLIVRTAPVLKDQQVPLCKIYLSHVYSAFWEKWFYGKLQKLQRKGFKCSAKPEKLKEALKAFFQSLSTAMFNPNERALVQKNSLFKTNKLFKTNPINQKVYRLFIENTDEDGTEDPSLLLVNPLCYVKENKCLFVHKSYQAYFAALLIISDLMQHKTDRTFFNYLKKEKNHMLFNVKMLNENPAIIHFIADYTKDKEGAYAKLESRFLAIIDYSRTEKGVACAGLNSMSTLNLSDFDFRNKNLRDINVAVPQDDKESSVDWIGPNLSGNNFDGTDFSNAALQGTNFKNTWLRKTKFQGTNMKDIDLGRFFELTATQSTIQSIISTNENQLFFASGKVIQCYDLATSEVTQTLKGHSSTVNHITLAPREKLLASASSDCTVNVWNLESSQIVSTFKTPELEALSVAFIPQSCLLASGGDDHVIYLWDVPKGKLLATLEAHTRKISSIVCASNGAFMASASYDKTIKLWDIKTWEVTSTLLGHSGYVKSVAFSPDDLLLVSGSSDNTVKLWEVQTAKVLKTLSGHQCGVTTVTFSPDGEWVMSGSEDNTVKIWEVASGNLVANFVDHSFQVSSAAFSPKGKRIVSGGYDKKIKLRAVVSNKSIVRTWQSHKKSIRSVDYAPNRTSIISGSEDAQIKLWCAQSGSEIASLKGHQGAVLSATFSSDSEHIASGSADYTVKVWNLVRCEALNTFQENKWTVTSVAFSPDSTQVIAGSFDKTIRHWDLRSGQLVYTSRVHNDKVNRVVYSPNEQCIASAGAGHDVKILDLRMRKILKTLRGHGGSVYDLNFSFNGKRIVSASQDKTANIWDFESGEVIHRLDHNDTVLTVAFSQDNERIVSGCLGKTTQLWNNENGSLIHTFKGHSGAVNSTVFSPSGERIVSGGDDKVIMMRSCLDWSLIWSRGPNSLFAEGAMVEDAVGLSKGNTRLLDQMSAITH